MHSDGLALALTLGLILDMLAGDPRWMPHPVRWMGKAIDHLEPRFRAMQIETKTAGGLMAALLVIAVWFISLLIVLLANTLHPLIGILVQSMMIFTCISARGLADAAREVGQALERSGLDAGRRAVAMIVGREVDQLDETGVTRATVETVAENLVDGVISPIFFVVIGGAPLAMAYKMVNTLDSMIGYKNDRYLHFGCFAAHLDDLANVIPARLSVPLIALAARLFGQSGRSVLKIARRDGRAHASPNAGYPEAAFAGALGLWMGGPNVYHGRLVKKPIIGKGLDDARPAHIDRACQLMLTTSLLAYTIAALTILVTRGMG